MRYPLLAQPQASAARGQPARPVPERVGEPSVFKHVVYIIKENRTYDQVLGDSCGRQRDPSLCIFGEKSLRTSTSSPASLCCWTTPTAPASLAPTDINGHDCDCHRLHGKILCRFSAQLSGRDGRSDIDALAYSPAGFHLGQRHRPRKNSPRLRRVRDHPIIMERQVPQRRASLSRPLSGVSERDR